MPMTQCYTCGNRYNTDLADECPICENRKQPTTPQSESDLVVQASDPSTDPGTLGKMALSDNPEVAEAAIANPNTPEWAKRRAQGNAVVESPTTLPKPKRTGAAPDLDASILRELRDIKDATRTIRNVVVTFSVILGLWSLLLAWFFLQAGSGP